MATRPPPDPPTIPSTIPITTASPYNTALYCSATCAEKDRLRNGQQIDQLIKEMDAWNIQSNPSGSRVALHDLPSPVWTGGDSSASEGEDASRTAVEPVPISTADPMADPSAGYFGMMTHGVTHGLLERERRRSSARPSISSTTTTSPRHVNDTIPSFMEAMMAQQHERGFRRSSSSSSGGRRGYHPTVASSDSLCTMESPGYTMDGLPCKHRSQSTSSGSNVGRKDADRKDRGFTRPGLADARWASFTRLDGHASHHHPAPCTHQATPTSRPSSSMSSTPRETHSGGSAPTFSRLHSYAAAFHRTESSVELARPLQLSPTKPFGSGGGSSDKLARSRRSSSGFFLPEAWPEHEVPGFALANATRHDGHARSSFAPISLALDVPVAGNNSSSNNSRQTEEPMTSGGGGGHPMVRSWSRDSRSSNKSRLDPLESAIAEEEEATTGEATADKHRRLVQQPTRTTARSRSSSAADRRAKKASSNNNSLKRNHHSFVFTGSPSTAVTVGDFIVAHPSVPFKPIFSKHSREPCSSSPPPGHQDAGPNVPLKCLSGFTRQPTDSRTTRSPVLTPTPCSPDHLPHASNTTAAATATALHRSFSWADLEREGKVAKTYAIPRAAMAKSDDKMLFYFA